MGVAKHKMTGFLLALSVLGSCSTTPPLIRAVEEGSSERVTELAAAVESEDVKARALELAVELRNEEVVRVLVNSGPFDRQPAVRAATLTGDLELLEVLLNGGAIATTASLNDAVESAHADCAIYLLDAGAEADGNTATGAVRTGDPDLLNQLLERGVTASDSALIAAVVAGDRAMIRLLLESGANPDACEQGVRLNLTIHENGFVAQEEQDSRGRTVLARAIADGDHALVRMLLDKGADPNHPVIPRRMPYETVDAGIGSVGDNGKITPANVSVMRSDGTGWQLETRQGLRKWTYVGCELAETRPDMARFARNQVTVPLVLAVSSPELEQNAQLKIVRALLDAGADPSATDEAGHDALHYAQKLGLHAVLDLLDL